MIFCFSLSVAASNFQSKSDICPTFSPSYIEADTQNQIYKRSRSQKENTKQTHRKSEADIYRCPESDKHRHRKSVTGVNRGRHLEAETQKQTHHRYTEADTQKTTPSSQHTDKQMQTQRNRHTKPDTKIQIHINRQKELT